MSLAQDNSADRNLTILPVLLLIYANEAIGEKGGEGNREKWKAHCAPQKFPSSISNFLLYAHGAKKQICTHHILVGDIGR